MPTYYTFKRDVPLHGDETLGFEPGHGYYARKPDPTPPPPVTVPYNPYGYVPGGSTTAVAQAIEAQAITTPGPNAVPVPISIEQGIPLSTEVTTSTGQVETFGQATGQTPKPPPVPAAHPSGNSFLDGAEPLSHGAAFEAIVAACDLYGVEDKAACADGLHEGFGGGIGDGGIAYGPWQEHLTDGRIAEIAGLPRYSEDVQAWAWSAAGIAHGVKGMADDSPSARGRQGKDAVYAIVYGFERPADKAGAFATRAAEYEHLTSLGAGWKAYVIARLAGPGLPGTTPTPLEPPAGATPDSVVGAKGSFGELMRVLAVTLPAAGARAKTLGGRLPGV